jgi:AraC-like DNA-binding protein
MDLLGQVLQSLRVLDSSIGIFELERPWGLSLPALDDTVFVFSPMQGDCLLAVKGRRAVRLRSGDVGLVLGSALTFRSQAAAPVQPFPGQWQAQQLPPLSPRSERSAPVQLRWGRPGPDDDRLLTLALVVRDVVHSPVLAVLPKLMVLPAASAGLQGWLQALSAFVVDECAAPSPGYNAIARQLATALFTLMIRRHAVQAGADKASWLRGMTDPHIGPALAVMHARSGEAWRLDDLARESGLARSTFSRRFRQCVGRAPMDYLAALRLHGAAERLVAGEPVARVAEQVGYRSEWAFRHAFVRQFGQTPLRYGKAMR